MLKKLLTLMGLVTAIALSQNYGSNADIAYADTNAHAFKSTTTPVRWVLVLASPANSTTNCGSSAISGCLRVGDSNISSTRGIPLQPGQSMFFPALPGNNYYDLVNLYYRFGNSGDNLSIVWGY